MIEQKKNKGGVLVAEPTYNSQKAQFGSYVMWSYVLGHTQKARNVVIVEKKRNLAEKRESCGYHA